MDYFGEGIEGEEEIKWVLDEEEMKEMIQQQKDSLFDFLGRKEENDEREKNKKEEEDDEEETMEWKGTKFIEENSFLGQSNHYFSFELNSPSSSSPFTQSYIQNQNPTTKGEEGMITPASYFERRSSRMGTLSGNASGHKRPNFSLQNIESPFIRKENVFKPEFSPSIEIEKKDSHSPIDNSNFSIDYGFTPHKTQLDSPTLHILQEKWRNDRSQMQRSDITQYNETDFEISPQKELDFECISYNQHKTKWIELRNKGINLMKISCSVVSSSQREEKRQTEMLSSFVISLQDDNLLEKEESDSSHLKSVDSTIFYLEGGKSCRLRVRFKAVDYHLQKGLYDYVAGMAIKITTIKFINGVESRQEMAKRIEMKASVGYTRLQMLRDCQNVHIRIPLNQVVEIAQPKIPMRNSGCIPLYIQLCSPDSSIFVTPSSFCLEAGQSTCIDIQMSTHLLNLPFSGYLLGKDLVNQIFFKIPLFITKEQKTRSH
eukprot:TRINITY_DN3807_c0_g1_i1.p1 TRINITY_DN3807_c0_g1~~TRINITY_DN3807_c0_g1_i1.p1  ORF type:complete len:487 (+),score=139.07 TRINITY_DN3807_c0_g1_i1:203-1663(+)